MDTLSSPPPFLLPNFSSGFLTDFLAKTFLVFFFCLGHFLSHFPPSISTLLAPPYFFTSLFTDFLAETFLSVLRSAKVIFLAFSAKHFNSTHSALFFYPTFHRFSSRDFSLSFKVEFSPLFFPSISSSFSFSLCFPLPVIFISLSSHNFIFILLLSSLSSSFRLHLSFSLYFPLLFIFIQRGSLVLLL